MTQFVISTKECILCLSQKYKSDTFQELLKVISSWHTILMINRKSFVQDKYSKSKEWQEVSKHSDSLYRYLRKDAITKELDSVNQPGVSSHKIQEIILRKASKLGFTNEKEGLFKKYSNSRLRPDFFLKVRKTGILIEVERGQTTQNNNDLKDFWKCHICEEAHYLFLFVPNLLIQNKTGRTGGTPFKTVNNHMSSFFEKENYTNVRGLVVFGY